MAKVTFEVTKELEKVWNDESNSYETITNLEVCVYSTEAVLDAINASDEFDENDACYREECDKDGFSLCDLFFFNGEDASKLKEFKAHCRKIAKQH